MKKELFLRRDELEDKTLRSVYFGGGTPSLLSVSEIEGILSEIQQYFRFAEDAEITLEANPDDLQSSFLRELKSATPINRLSIGIQSFAEEDLRLMNRAHTAGEARKCVEMAQNIGYENINIDLIYGIPTADFAQWQRNLAIAANELDIQHISSYALTVEPKTALNQWIKKNPNLAPKEGVQSRDFFYMIDFLEEKGFEHYEISNFAKRGFHSRHNSAYWEYRPYLGIGPSAHSYDGKSQRSWNVANNTKYIKSLAENKLPHEVETLSLENQYNEILMIGLRTQKGVSLSQIESHFPKQILERFTKDITPKIEDGNLIIEDNHLRIPKEKWFLADGIASDLFLLSE